MERMDTHELISALADGELGPDDTAAALARLSDDPQALAAWRDYHLVGDVLRSADLARTSPPGPFMARLSARLAQEAAPSGPSARPAHEIRPVEQVAVAQAVAANDGSFRWKLVAGLASAAAVAAVGWSLLAAGVGGSPAGPQLASAPASPPQAVMIRDPQLDELLAAHRQHGDATALQMPAGFLRNATFDVPGR